MKIFSLHYLKTSFSETFKRFPLPVLCSLLFTIYALSSGSYYLETIWGVGWNNFAVLTALFCCFFGLVSLKLVFESHGWNLKWYYGAAILMCLAIIGCFRYAESYILVFEFLAPAAFFSIFVAPFLKKDVDGLCFWNFAYRVSNRILLTILAAIILYLALLAIMLTIATLFYLFDINDLPYFATWKIITGFFSPFFALAGLPSIFNEEMDDYPQFKIITYYIILPGALIYTVLLHLYALKIAVGWNLPDGYVSYLVLAFSGVAIITYIACYPLHLKREETINQFVKYLPYALIVPLIILFVAIGFRIRQYGITEDRYMVVMLGIWVTASALFIRFKNAHLPPPHLIVFTFVVLCILASFGPWGAIEISARNQIHRFKEALEENHIFDNGKIKPNAELPFAEKARISRIADYLVSTGKEARVYKWSPNFANGELGEVVSLEGASGYGDSAVFASTMGLRYSASYEHDPAIKNPSKYFAFKTSCYDNKDNTIDCVNGYRNIVSDIKGYETFLLIDNIGSLQQQNNGYLGKQVAIKGKAFQIYLAERRKLIIRKENMDNQLEIDLTDFVMPLNEPQKKEIVVENKNFMAKLIITNMGGNYNEVDNEMEIHSLDAALFIGVK